MSMSRERRILKELEKKKRFEKAFRMHSSVGVSKAEFKIIDKNGNDVTKERIKDAVSN